MEYPLNFSFKVLALAPQLMVTDAAGEMLFYVKQKMFKLKEAVTVYADKGKSEELYKIKADRVLDFSAAYHFTDTEGNELGSVRRKGMKSIWKAHYEVYDGDQQVMSIQEENAWVKVLESLLGQIPIIGMIAAYLLNPAYIVSRSDGTPVYKLKKQPAFFEGKFELTRLEDVSELEEKRSLLALLMMTLLERGRG